MRWANIISVGMLLIGAVMMGVLFYATMQAMLRAM
jgi:hypothetical protein